jgi:hypothetical protein
MKKFAMILALAFTMGVAASTVTASTKDDTKKSKTECCAKSKECTKKDAKACTAEKKACCAAKTDEKATAPTKK